MRPLRLEVEGLTCFRERQVIDFSALSLFAIAGPTGSGKSSLLDAMVYGLYGRIPRMGGQGVKDFVALGAAKLNVTFDFALGTSQYRIGRIARSDGTNPRAQLERFDGAGWLPVAEGVRPVDAEVSRLLGMTQDAFQQSVLLPQGEFAKFLKSKPAEQRTILRELLKLGVYQAMRQRAEERRREHAAEGNLVQEVLEREYAQVTDERLAEVRDRLGAVRGEVEHLGARAEASRVELGRVERLAALWQDRRSVASERDAHELRRLEMSALQIRVAAAERAAPVLPRCEEVSRAAAEAESAKGAHEKATGLREVRAQTRERLAKSATDAEQACLVLPAMRERIAEIDRLTPQVVALREGRAELARQVAQRSDAEKNLQAVQGRIVVLTAECAEALQGTAALSSELTSLVAPDEAELREAEARAAVLGSERQRALALDTEIRTLRAATAGRAGLEEALTAARTAHERCAAELAAAERADLAHAVRGHLVAGQPCPVCEEVVRRVPPAAGGDSLDGARRAARAAADSRARAEAEWAALAPSLARLQAREVDLAGSRAAIEATEQGLARWARPGIPVEDAIRAAREVAQRHARLRSDLSAAETRLAKLDGEILAAREQEARHDSDLRRLDAGIAEAGPRLDALDLAIRDAIPDGDVAGARSRLATEVDRLESDRDASLRALSLADAELASAVAGAAEAEKQLHEAEARRSASEARAREAATAAGFASLDAARAAGMDDALRRREAAKVESWNSQLKTLNQRLAELAEALGDTPVGEAELATARAAAQSAESSLGAAQRDAGRLAQEAESLAAALAIAHERRATLARHREEERWYGILAADLRTDGFEAWLLESTFRELVAGASVRLMELSGRYALAWDDETFWVVDHDHGRERRKADTLSGGETFLASLSLALELSAQVQRAAGAVRLDSLFIDEGFGTLDPDTLETVAAAILQLGAADRTVGVVTHVAELVAHMPARIEVRKELGGSRVHVVHA